MENNFKYKYLKYKSKYLTLLSGGSSNVKDVDMIYKKVLDLATVNKLQVLIDTITSKITDFTTLVNDTYTKIYDALRHIDYNFEPFFTDFRFEELEIKFKTIDSNFTINLYGVQKSNIRVNGNSFIEYLKACIASVIIPTSIDNDKKIEMLKIIEQCIDTVSDRLRKMTVQKR